MKPIVYVLSALLLLSYVSAASTPNKHKQDLDVSQLQNDPNLQDALKYGINWIFEQAANKYRISNLNITVTKVNKIQKWQDKRSTYYYFDVEAKNDDATITSTYSVKCNGKSGELSVVNKWNYKIADYEQNQESDEECESVNADENVEIDVEVDVEVPVDVEEECEDDENPTPEEDCEESHVDIEVNVEVDIEVSVEDDEEDCSDEENQEGEEAANQCKQGDEVDVSEVKKDSHLKKALTFGLTWIFRKAADKFNISDSESDIDFTKANLICRWKDGGDTYYYFDVQGENDDVTLNATYNVKCKSKSGDLRVVNQWRYTVDFKENKQCKEGEEVSMSEIEKDSDLRGALVHGISWIFAKAHDKFNISVSNIMVTRVRSVCSWKEGSDDYYSFDVEAVNGEVILNATYSVRCDSKTGDLRVVNEWKYRFSYNNKDDNDNNTDDCEDQGNDNNQDDDDGYDGGVDVEVEIEVDVEVDVDNNTDEEECEVKDDDDNDNNTNDGNGYKPINLSDCESDEIRDIIDQAIEYVTCEETKKISKDDYYLKKIVSAERKQTSDGNYYRFEVIVESQDGCTEIDLKFESEVKNGKSADVLSYWFHISSIKN